MTSPRALLAAVVAISLAAVPGVLAVSAYSYDGPGVVVLDAQRATIADNGAVVCEDADGDGVPEKGTGGVCIPFDQLPDTDSGEHPAVRVVDDEVGESVAFQVCVDNDGDGVCTFGLKENPVGDPAECFDEIRFSHGDGVNVNPLAVPDGFAFPGCADNGGFPGVIVAICAGAHESASEGAHSHEATAGSAQTTTTTDTSTGDFCGARSSAKAYVVE